MYSIKIYYLLCNKIQMCKTHRQAFAEASVDFEALVA